MKIWSSHLLDNLNNCLMNLKNSGDSAGFESMTSAMPAQCSNQLSYEVTQLRAGQFVGLMFSRERNVVWKKCYVKCGVWNQMKIWSSHLLDNLSNCLMNLKNSGDSTGFKPMTSAEFFRFMRQLLRLRSMYWQFKNYLYIVTSGFFSHNKVEKICVLSTVRLMHFSKCSIEVIDNFPRPFRVFPLHLYNFFF